MEAWVVTLCLGCWNSDHMHEWRCTHAARGLALLPVTEIAINAIFASSPLYLRICHLPGVRVVRHILMNTMSKHCNFIWYLLRTLSSTSPSGYQPSASGHHTGVMRPTGHNLVRCLLWSTQLATRAEGTWVTSYSDSGAKLIPRSRKSFTCSSRLSAFRSALFCIWKLCPFRNRLNSSR